MKRSYLVSILFFVIMLIAMRWQGAQLISPATPKGIIDIEFAGSASAFELMLMKLDVNAIKLNTYIDFLFLIAYGWLLFTLCTYVYDNTGWKLAKYMRVLPVAASIFDIVENVLILKSLNQPVDTLIRTISQVAAIKFILAGITILFLIVSFIVIAGRRLKA